MRLTRPGAGSIGRSLAILTANLLGVSAAQAQTAPARDQPTLDDTQTSLGTTEIDSAVLFYQEDGGRVQAIEPTASLKVTDQAGDIFSFKFVSDTLTGATPNGATPWSQPQTFTVPARGASTTTTVTGASGHLTKVTLPGGVIANQYTTPANRLPVDTGFRDQRYAFDAGYSYAWSADTNLSIGAAASIEKDYTSISLNAGFSRDLNQKNTTVSIAGNIEYDKSRPFFGAPPPFAVQDGTQQGGNATKWVFSAVGGVTQVMNRYWLAQVNVSVGYATGYQNDPYRIISVLDGATGAPQLYLYENRPRSRFRESVYVANKIAIGPTVADISGRFYHDSWGITSYTGEISERVPITHGLYIEPLARYYHQSAANFFQNYLIAGAPLPSYASSDSRLDKFSATTFGVKAGIKVGHDGEFYMLGERYTQSGDRNPPGTIPGLAGQNLFGGVKATSVVAGFRFTFR